MSNGKGHEPRALHRYAWRYFMSNYREGRTRISAGDYLLRGVFFTFAAIYAGVELHFRFRIKDDIGVLLASLFVLGLIWLLLRTARAIYQLSLQAGKFADDALASANNRQGIEEFFDEQFPWLFYQK